MERTDWTLGGKAFFRNGMSLSDRPSSITTLLVRLPFTSVSTCTVFTLIVLGRLYRFLAEISKGFKPALPFSNCHGRFLGKVPRDNRRLPMFDPAVNCPGSLSHTRSQS
jgi:hypothetical protein